MIPATVTVHGLTWNVQVATTSAEIAQGFSNVASTPADSGILFDMGSEQLITINMQEMLFPLDVVFFDKDKKVTEIGLGVIPLNDITTTIPARFFMEVNDFEADNVAVGDIATFSGYTPPTASTPTAGLDISAMLNLMVTMMIIGMMMRMMSGMMSGVSAPAKKQIQWPTTANLNL